MVGDGKYSGCESPSGRRELAGRVEGKVALITGGGRGQGRVPTLALARRCVAVGAISLLPGGMIDNEDVAHAVAWLASEESRWVTGVMLPIDAGINVKL